VWHGARRPQAATVVEDIAGEPTDRDTRRQLIAAAVFDRYDGGWRAIALTADELLAGYTLIACADCIGSGVFVLPDDETRCPTCKGSSLMGVAR
jgi:hypothetical protein